MGNSEDTPKPPPKTLISPSSYSRTGESVYRPESNTGYRSSATDRQPVGYSSHYIPQERLIPARPYTPSSGVTQYSAASRPASVQGSQYKSTTSYQPYVPTETHMSKASPSASHPLSLPSQGAKPASFQGDFAPRTSPSTYAPYQQAQVKSSLQSNVSAAQASQSKSPFASPYTTYPYSQETQYKTQESHSYTTQPKAPATMAQGAYYDSTYPSSTLPQVPQNKTSFGSSSASSSPAAQHTVYKPDPVQTKAIAPVSTSALSQIVQSKAVTYQASSPTKATAASSVVASAGQTKSSSASIPQSYSSVQTVQILQSSGVQSTLPKSSTPSNPATGLTPGQYPTPASPSLVQLSHSSITCRVRFADLLDYQEHFLRLLDLERGNVASGVNGKLAGAKFQTHGSQGKRTVYRLTLASIEDFNYGDQFLVRYKNNGNEVVHIHNIDEEHNQIEFHGKYSDAASIEYYQSIPHRRMTEKLESIDETHPLLPQLLGDSDDNAYGHPWSYASNPNLDEYQNEAVRQALCSKITLIHGPPGSGKTSVAAQIVLELSKRAGNMLVCAPSNVATDNLAIRIRSLKLNVVRFYSKGAEKKDNIADHFAFHSFLHTLACVSFPDKAGKLLSAKNHSRNVVKAIIGEQEVVALEKEVLQSFQIICCTCVASADAILKNFVFDHVIIDEAAFCTEPEALIPIAAGCQKIILIGDPKQLQPVVYSEEAKKQCYNISLFERLENARFHISMLAIQYRMHPVISSYPRMKFYAGKLADGVDSAKRSVEKYTVTHLFPKSPVVFVHCEGQEDYYQGTTSRWNKQEADLVLMLLKRFMACEVHWKSIGVVTPYEGQRLTLADQIQQEFPQTSTDIEVKNIDGYQGREKDFIIISCVRSNSSQKVGFLSIDNRINVALTRAKYGLIVIGNANTLRGNATWGGFLDYVQSKGETITEAELKGRSEEYEKKLKFGYT